MKLDLSRIGRARERGLLLDCVRFVVRVKFTSGVLFFKHNFGLIIANLGTVGVVLLLLLLLSEFISLNRVINFPTVYWDFLRSFHSQANFVATDLDDYDRNVIIDDNTFVLLSR
ncbi:MAG: hypothetical protein ACI814_003397 [Mariniblastus sp.]